MSSFYELHLYVQERCSHLLFLLGYCFINKNESFGMLSMSLVKQNKKDEELYAQKY